MKIAFDFDGVICDSHNAFRGHFWDIFGYNIPTFSDLKTYSLGIEHCEFYEPWWWKEIPVALARYQHICPPIHNSIEALEAISKQPYIEDEEIVIITARENADAVRQVTNLWCHLNFNFNFDIHYCGTPEGKYEIFQDLGIEYYVDDRFKTCQEIIDFPSMKVAFMFNAPYNKDYGDRESLKSRVYRIESLWDMKKYLDNQLLA